VKSKRDSWIDLLLTDSLGRPLAGAPYSVHEGPRPWKQDCLHGHLDQGGRVSLRWHPEGLSFFVGYRSLLLQSGPTEGALRTRNRLTCLGYDAGPPDSALDSDRASRALAALIEHAHHDTDSSVALDADPESVLEDWVRGRIGVGEPASAGSRPSTLRVWSRIRRRKRARGRRFTVTPDRRRTAKTTITMGSHMCPLPHSPAARPFHTTRLAVTVGAQGSPQAANRIVIYDWFTGLGPPPCDGNQIESLIDGELAWGAVALDLEQAQRELCVTTWWADPDIELTRPEELALDPPAQRSANRFASYVERLAQRGGRTTILLWSWLGTPILNATLRRWAIEAGDNVEVLQRDNPRPLGSFHQKTMVIDQRVAYCGGFNLRQNDWDTQQHRIDEPRRNPHDTSADERAGALPAFPPRHDVTARIQGPLVAHVHDAFVAYWNPTVENQGAMLKPTQRGLLARMWARLNGVGPADQVTPMRAGRKRRVGNMLAQLVQTEPHRRPREQPIYDVLLRAIHNGRRLIYIENQYFRSSRITQALVSSLRQHPDMCLVVVTNEVATPFRFAYGGAYYTARAQEAIRQVRPDFELYQLLSRGLLRGAVRYRPIEVHAKVMIVDDEWCTIGSANLNERSIRSEAEANVAIEDERFAKQLRCALMAEHLGLSPEDPRLADLGKAASTFKQLAAQNAAARRAGVLASGHAHPFEQRPSWRWLRGRAEWY